MRRPLLIAALLTLLLTSPAWSQMRGHGGFAGGRGGFAPRGSSFAAHGSFHSSNRFGTGFHRPFFPGGRFHHRNRFFFNGGFPFFAYSGFYGYPYDYGYYSGPVADYSYQSYDSYNAFYDQQRRTEDRLDRLEDRIDRMRDQDQYRAEARVPRPPRDEAIQSRVLVFRDKHTEEVQNYGIAGQTLWIFTEQRARKIPLSDLDLSATAKANEQRGLDFQLPPAK